MDKDGSAGDPDEVGAQGKQTKMFKGFWDTFFFGIAIKWAVFASFWHYGLTNGFREYMIAFLILTVGYAMLAFSLAEMVSVIAFPGGYYGYARCTVHPFFGYLVGCSGVIETVFVTAATVMRMGQTITIVCGGDPGLEPLWWVLFHGFAIFVHVQHHKVYWTLMLILTGLCVVVFMSYILGSIPVENFYKYSNIPNTSLDIFSHDFLEILSIPSIFYYGCDLIVIVSHEVENSKQIIPRAMLLSYAVMCVIAVAIIFTAVSQAPGITSEFFSVVFPLAFGFKSMLHIDLNHATSYIIPSMFSSLLGYMFVSGRMVSAFAKSGLLPSFMRIGEHSSSSASPISLIFTSSIGLCLQAVAWTYDTGISFRAAIHAAFFVYIGMLTCYIVFQQRYQTLPRTFRSPFGTIGALIGLVIFVLSIISLFLSAVNNIATYIYITCMGGFIIYYLCSAKLQQQFSNAEQKEFFKVYIINMNSSKKRRHSYLLPTFANLRKGMSGMAGALPGSAVVAPKSSMQLSKLSPTDLACATSMQYVPELYGWGEQPDAHSPSDQVASFHLASRRSTLDGEFEPHIRRKTIPDSHAAITASDDTYMDSRDYAAYMLARRDDDEGVTQMF